MFPIDLMHQVARDKFTAHDTAVRQPLDRAPRRLAVRLEFPLRRRRAPRFRTRSV
jgi:hypothetical protein